MRNTILILLFCAGLHTAVSQQLYFNHLSPNNGLSQGVNNCIYKDSKGFVWISSFDGLNRFDGIDCKKYYSVTGDQKGIKGTLFLNILEDASANVWIGSNEGLNCYNRTTGSFVCYRITGNAEQFCSPFYIDNKNRIWVQSRSDLLIFDPSTRQFTKLNSHISGGNLLVKTVPEQLYKPVEKLLLVSNNSTLFQQGTVTGSTITWQTDSFPVKVLVYAMLVNGNKCWLGTGNGLYTFDMNAVSTSCTKMNSMSYSISSMHFDNTGTLWAGSFHNGLFKVDTSGKVLAQYYNDQDNNYSISGNQVVYIYTDDNRNLWVAVWGKGVDYTNLGKFHFNQHISKAEAFKTGTDNFIRSVTGVNNEIWCATQSGGIIVLDSAKKIKQVIRQGLPSSVEHLCADGSNMLAATFNGLFSVNAINKTVQKVETVKGPPVNPASLQYNYTCRLKNGNLLLSSNAGLYVLKKETKSRGAVLLKGIEAGDVYLTTYENSAGQLFISKAFKGFGMYTLQNDSLLLIKQFPMQATIKCFMDTPDSLLWIGSTVGLMRFNKTTASITRIYTTADGLNNQYIYGVVQDNDYLWLSSNAGISRFQPVTGMVKTFSTADGLQGNEYNTYSFYKTSSGEILFGGVNGLNSFRPSYIKPFKTSPQFLLSNILVNDSLYPAAVSYTELHSLDVKYKQNTLGFQFTVIDYVDAAAAHILYMLEGYDKGWVQAANKTYIRYVNIPAGHYTLKVKAFNADGVMAGNIFELAVIVQPPWWQTWWFRLLTTAIVTMIVLLLVKNYLRRKLRKQKIEMEKELAVEQERIRMARELHDGLGSMLSGIKHSFNAIKNEIAMSAAQQHQFDYTIDKLDDSIKDLRAVSHTMFSAELLEQGLEAAIKNYCSAVSVTAKIPVAFENIYQQPAALNGEQAFHIFRIVQELIQNVIRHSKASSAIVQLSYTNGLLAVTVEDNGVGFNPLDIKEYSGIGLKNAESRVKLLHGKMDVQSQEGKGTSVFIEINL